jgi:hypothetical protein
MKIPASGHRVRSVWIIAGIREVAGRYLSGRFFARPLYARAKRRRTNSPSSWSSHSISKGGSPRGQSSGYRERRSHASVALEGVTMTIGTPSGAPPNHSLRTKLRNASAVGWAGGHSIGISKFRAIEQSTCTTNISSGRPIERIARGALENSLHHLSTPIQPVPNGCNATRPGCKWINSAVGKMDRIRVSKIRKSVGPSVTIPIIIFLKQSGNCTKAPHYPQLR